MKHAVKGIFAVLIFGLVFWLAWKQYSDFLYQGQKPTRSTQVLNEITQKGVPDFTLKDLSGLEIGPGQFKDKILVINFWASWCNPCVEEFPSLIKLIEHYNGEVVLLAISADHEEVEMVNFINAFGFKNKSIHVMWDKEQNVAKKYGTFVLPESYILTYDNKFVRKIAGVDDWASKYALEFFDELIKGKETTTDEK